MAKGNQKAQQKQDEANIEGGFDKIITSLDSIADGVEQTMPLVAQSLRLTISLVKLYKKGYHATKSRKNRA